MGGTVGGISGVYAERIIRRPPRHDQVGFGSNRVIGPPCWATLGVDNASPWDPKFVGRYSAA